MIMDNQKSNDGNARNVGSEGSGSSMGKDLSKDSGSNDHITSKTVGMGNLDKGLDKSTSATGSTQERSSSASSTSQDKDTTQDKNSSLSSANLDKTVEKTATSAHDTIDKAAEAVQPMADRLATSAHAGVDKVSNALSGVSGRMDEKTKQLSDAYGKFAETGREYVRSSPATSVLVALAAGYTLSKIFGGRRH
jgi:hypothetical protein